MEKNKSKIIIISPQAKEDILQVLQYLEENWGKKVVEKFLENLQTFYKILLLNPRLFGFHNKSKNIRKYAISKQSILYYRITRKNIQIITLFDVRQNPGKLKRLLKN